MQKVKTDVRVSIMLIKPQNRNGLCYYMFGKVIWWADFVQDDHILRMKNY